MLWTLRLSCILLICNCIKWPCEVCLFFFLNNKKNDENNQWYILNGAMILYSILFPFLVLSGKVVIDILAETCYEASASRSELYFVGCLSRLWFSLFTLCWCRPIWFFTLQWNINTIKLSSVHWRLGLPLWLQQSPLCRKPLWGTASVWPTSLFKWIYVGCRYL